MSNGRKLKGWYKLRWEILERDKFTCQYCGQSAPSVTLQVDHKLPVVEGGTDETENLVAACSACNGGKEGLRQWIIRKARKSEGKSIKPSMVTSKILELLVDGPLSSRDISVAGGLAIDSVRSLLSRLKARGTVMYLFDSRKYAISESKVINGVTQAPPII